MEINAVRGSFTDKLLWQAFFVFLDRRDTPNSQYMDIWVTGCICDRISPKSGQDEFPSLNPADN